MAEAIQNSNKIGLAAGGLGAVVLGAAQTRPEDAISNLAGWLELLGVNEVPGFIANQQADTWGTMVGIVLLLFGIAMWWRNRQRSEVALTLHDQPLETSGWMPLHQALHYLVYESRWAETQPTPANKMAFDHAVDGEFLEQLARGDVKARGKAGWENAAIAQRTTQPIPADFWTRAFILSHDKIVLADSENDAVGRSGEQGYRYVVIDRYDVERIWPRSAASVGLTPLAAFCEPLRRQIEQEKSQ
jgi:hypothetical protein